jgi:hypothetical protein
LTSTGVEFIVETNSSPVDFDLGSSGRASS